MSPAQKDRQGTQVWLLAATLVVAVAGLIYELIAATVSSYLLGDSIRQFSFVIGVFLASMGVGAWVSRFVGDAVAGFFRAQVGLGLFGGLGALGQPYLETKTARMLRKRAPWGGPLELKVEGYL
ncbi:MAG: hypothetical protein AAGK57_03525, partial [Pseudomonadota bacterium]